MFQGLPLDLSVSVAYAVVVFTRPFRPEGKKPPLLTPAAPPVP